jgi:adiponectin receptor
MLNFLHKEFSLLYSSMPVLTTRDKIASCFHRDYIHDGYRADYSFSQTLLSLFTLHNETMNIWSHLIGFICVLIAAFSLTIEFQLDEVPILERILMGVYLTSAAMCMLLSTIYHWFGCLSKDHYFALLSLDLTGIAGLIAGSYFPASYYAFYCTPNLQVVYLITSTLILVVGIVIAVFGSSESKSAALIRNGGFGSLVIFGLVPITRETFPSSVLSLTLLTSLSFSVSASLCLSLLSLSVCLSLCH